MITASKTHPFAVLKNIRIGDLIKAETLSGNQIYFKTIKVEIIHKDHILLQDLLLNTPPSRLILLTSYPFNTLNYGGPMRYAITAARTS